MRAFAILLPLVFLAACGSPNQTVETAPGETTEAGPDVGISAAAGIALDYAYRFRLPAAAIAGAQERHAAACEQVGPRCRITGLHYRVDDRRSILATLDLALDPTIARAFGRNAVANVVQARGSLIETEIGTKDVGSTVREAGSQRADAAARLRTLDQRLSDPRTRAEERAVLAREAASLRERIDTASTTVASGQATLATTPMHIAYEAGDLVPGFDRTAPLRDAGASAIDGFIGALAALLTILAVLLPWAIAGVIGLWLWRRYGHRFLRRVPGTPDPE